ncbi:MFS transporter [Amycolatopsis sp. K13G38]|uniref:MFS transporter n=1 Tax=Amycolatopsis acididurans TaxID=2724524 RepID=A0ABX1J5R5_9PSEU|nr:MFS transporter [Amycolatopsis acididurans]NKQ55004.1 MFS transporter [Amycolatopsis acididurans]
MSRTRKGWVLAAITLAQLLIIIDVTVINVAMPSAQRDLGMSEANKQWMVSAYTLTFGGLLLLGGRVSDRFGHRRTLLTGLCGFALASAVAGAASNPLMMVFARAGQGMFAALLAPAALSLLAITFPHGRERSNALAVFGTVVMSGGVAGLLLGGALTQFLGWRWCMFIKLPLAIVVGIVGFLFWPNPAGKRTTRLDSWSALGCTGGMIALVYALSETVTRGWSSVYVMGAFCVALVLLLGFVLRQITVNRPLVPLTIFSSRSRVSSYLATVVLAFGMFGVWVFLTYQFQRIMGYPPLLTGLAFVPMVGANLAGISAFSRRLVRRASLGQVLALRLLVAACGMILLTQLTPESSFWTLILPAELLLGFGAGLALPAVMDSAVGGVAAHDSGVASALFQTSNMMGASLGTALLTTIALDVTDATANPESAAAIAHGYAVAAIYAAGLLIVGAVTIGLLLRGRPA